MTTRNSGTSARTWAGVTRISACLLAIVLLVLGCRAFWWEPRSLALNEVRLDVPGWPPGKSGLRVAVLTDLHVGAPYIDLAKLRRIVDMTHAAHPDVSCFLGDLGIQGVRGGRFVSPEESCAVLQDLRAPLGLFAVLGNHDWWLDAPRVASALRSAGFSVIDDDAIRIEATGGSFWMAGASDFNEGPHNWRKALRRVDDSDPVLLITHNPDLFPLLPARVNLTIAGHTHGGQVNLPILGRLIVPSHYGSRYAAGEVIEDGRHLYVSTGIGTSIIPVRFRVAPEISILELRSPDDNDKTHSSPPR